MSASGRSHNDDSNCNCGGRRRRPVDEDMIVLRKRIHEMKMVDRNYEPPTNWMEWEKRYYTSYDSILGCFAIDADEYQAERRFGGGCFDGVQFTGVGCFCRFACC
ncbi:hypothetical protein V6N12_000991 [Hibiscus sabdariffa]